MKRFADVLTSHYSRTSSVPPALSSLVTLHVPIHLRTTVEPLGAVWPVTKGLEPLISVTASHLAPDRWIWSRTTQHWSGNRLSSSVESSSLKHARRNDNVHQWTSHMMIMMTICDWQINLSVKPVNFLESSKISRVNWVQRSTGKWLKRYHCWTIILWNHKSARRRNNALKKELQTKGLLWTCSTGSSQLPNMLESSDTHSDAQWK